MTPGNGDALLLTAGEQMGRVRPGIRTYPPAFRALSTRRRISGAGHAQILRAKGHVLLHHVGNDLVVRVLENHTHAAADCHNSGQVGGVDAVHIHLSAGRQQDRIEVLCQGGFSAAVGAQDGHKAAAFNGKI